MKIALSTCLHHNIILNEVQEQGINLVGCSNFTGIQVVNVQQQPNGSDCGVFAAAFATCLVYGIHPETLQLDFPKNEKPFISVFKIWCIEKCFLHFRLRKVHLSLKKFLKRKNSCFIIEKII